MGEEKRQSPRVGIDEVVGVFALPDSRSAQLAKNLNLPHFLKAKNISQEGLCLETPNFFIPDQVFKLEFQVPHEGRSRAYASVVWSEKNACGLRFIKQGEHLNNLIQRESTQA